MDDKETVEETLILRDVLALQRTRLANERTLLSYARTSLYLVVGGIALIKVEEFENTKFIGALVIAASLAIFLLGLYRYIKLRQKIRKQINKQVGF